MNLTRARLSSRYSISGLIMLDTALHIGGQDATTITDSPVIRDGWDRPFIPGSSLKGAFRAAVERIVPNLPGLNTCSINGDEDSCAVKLHKRTKDQRLNELELLVLLDEVLCDTCRTFGTTYLASVALFHDAYLSKTWRNLAVTPTQIRDGVGIDRDSECARDGFKFDFEVVYPQTEFEFTLTLENPGNRDLGLIALGLKEFIEGQITLGGIRSRGLGRCHLKDAKMQYVNFNDRDALKAYLIDGHMNECSADEFIKTHLGSLLKEAY